MNSFENIVDPYTDDDPEYKDTPIVSPIPPPGYQTTTIGAIHHQSDHGRPGQSSNPSSNINIPNTSNLLDSSQTHVDLTSSYQRIEVKYRTDRVIPEKQMYDWLHNYKDAPSENDLSWLIIKVEKAAPIDYGVFSIQDVFESLLDLKNQLDGLPKHYFNQARSIANPYEAIGKAVFVNRSAVKMANLDSLFGFTKELITPGKAFRFADLCAGPGGFTEYMLWRLQPGIADVHGYGMTLKSDLDFAINQFARESYAEHRFEAIYGADGTGDITKPENMRRFAAHLQKVAFDGVDLVMADGAFSVVGDELYQEVHSNRLIMCEVVMMFMVLRKGGEFMTKVFDTCTPFMAGLIYILHKYFDKITMVKPFTSRPANSERFIVCKGLKQRKPPVIKHLLNVNKKFNELSSKQQENTSSNAFSLTPYKTMIEQGVEVITQIVDLDNILKAKEFVDYLEGKNTTIAMKQIQALQELIKYGADPSLPTWNQEEIRKKCLQEWNLPLLKKETPLKTLISQFEPFARRTSSPYHPTHPPLVYSSPPSSSSSSSSSSYGLRHSYRSDILSALSTPTPKNQLHLADKDMNWRERNVVKKTENRILLENHGIQVKSGKKKADNHLNWRERAR